MPRDAESTRRRVLAVALGLFHRQGFAGTTMRQIATEAGLSLGAAYHHFDSKQAIVFAYYEELQEEHEEAARAALAQVEGLRERLGMVMHTGLDVRGKDRALLRELAPFVIGPDDTLSAFSGRTRALRERSIGLHREAVEDPSVPEDLRDPAALALWALSLGLLYYFANDDSPRQQKSRDLVNGALDLTAMIFPALGMPLFTPVRDKLRGILRDADLLPT